MKTLLSIILLSFITYGQWTPTKSRIDGKYRDYTNGDSLAISVWMINEGSSTGSTSDTYSKIDTAETTSDSISLDFQTVMLNIINTGSQIVYFCTDTSFGDNKVPVPPGTPFTWKVRDNKFHYKSAASTSIVYMVAQ